MADDAPTYCFLWLASQDWACMPRDEWASWVSAGGSILAIVASVAVASWSLSRQFSNEAKRQREAQADDRQRIASTLAQIARNAYELLSALHAKCNTREAVYLIAAEPNPLPFHLPELDAVLAALSGIPLHELPADLASPAMRSAWTVRQFRTKMQMVLAGHRDMNAAAFEDFFEAMPALCLQLQGDLKDIDAVVGRSAAVRPGST